MIIQKTIKIVLAVVLVAANTIAFAQSYFIFPNDSMVSNAPFGRLSHFTIQQKNNSNNTLVLSWQQIALNIPTGWEANLCDNGHCYINFPMSGSMDSVNKAEYGLMAIGINPDTINGTAFIQYAVWDANIPTKKDTLTWIIFSDNTTGINQLVNKNNVNIFPNPSSDELKIISDLQSGFTFLITDDSGKEIKIGFSKTNAISINTNSFIDGIYSLSILSLDKKIVTNRKFAVIH